MKTKDFDIAFIGLSNGAHVFEFDLNDSFFELFEYDDYSQLSGKVTVEMVKSETVMGVHACFFCCEIWKRFPRETGNRFP